MRWAAHGELSVLQAEPFWHEDKERACGRLRAVGQVLRWSRILKVACELQTLLTLCFALALTQRAARSSSDGGSSDRFERA